MNLPAAEIPDQPAVHGSEAQLPLFRPPAGIRNVVQDPGKLGSRKVRIGNQTGFFMQHRFQPTALQFFAPVGRPAALPDDCRADRFACCTVPNHHGFALVGDPDGCDFGGADACTQQSLYSNSHLRCQNFGCVLFDPAVSRIALTEFTVDLREHVPVPVKNDAAGTGGSLIEC